MGFHQTKKFMCSKENDQQNKAELTEQGKYLPTICPASNWYSECRVFVHVYVCKCTVCVCLPCVQVCMYVCRGQRTISGAILQQVSTLFSSFSSLLSPFLPLSSSSLFFLSPFFLFETESLTGPELTKKAWLASLRAQRSSHLHHFSNCGFPSVHYYTWLFVQALGIKLRSLSFCRKHLMTELSVQPQNVSSYGLYKKLPQAPMFRSWWSVSHGDFRRWSLGGSPGESLCRLTCPGPHSVFLCFLFPVRWYTLFSHDLLINALPTMDSNFQNHWTKTSSP